jgi:hypothetical protein
MPSPHGEEALRLSDDMSEHSNSARTIYRATEDLNRTTELRREHIATIAHHLSLAAGVLDSFAEYDPLDMDLFDAAAQATAERTEPLERTAGQVQALAEGSSNDLATEARDLAGAAAEYNKEAARKFADATEQSRQLSAFLAATREAVEASLRGIEGAKEKNESRGTLAKAGLEKVDRTASDARLSAGMLHDYGNQT